MLGIAKGREEMTNGVSVLLDAAGKKGLLMTIAGHTVG